MRRNNAKRTLALLLSATILTTASASITSPSSATTLSQDSDKADIALDSYLSLIDRNWTGSEGKSAHDSDTTTEALTVNLAVRKAMAEAGAPIVDAESTIEILDEATNESGTLLLRASITTSFTYGGDGAKWPSGSAWTDEHEIEVELAGTEPRVVSDRVVSPTFDNTPGTPTGPVPVASSAERTTENDGTFAGNKAQPHGDVYEMQGYATKWSSSPYDGDSVHHFNPDFPYLNNNCANFVSQILRSGGWNFAGGVNPNDTANWTPNLTGPAGPSRTWSSSRYQYTYAKNNGYEYMDNIWNANAGDLLYTDWDPDNTPDGQIDHVMFVAYDSFGEPSGPLIVQKSPNRSMIPIAQTIANATAQGKSIVWFGLTR